jgi:hypothetical protein
MAVQVSHSEYLQVNRIIRSPCVPSAMSSYRSAQPPIQLNLVPWQVGFAPQVTTARSAATSQAAGAEGETAGARGERAGARTCRPAARRPESSSCAVTVL